MAIRMISLTYELDNLLRNESNASALISSLLNEHYKNFSSMTLEEVRAKRKRFLEENPGREDALEQLHKLELELIAEEEDKKKLEQERKEIAISTFIDTFNTFFEIPEEQVRAIAEEFEAQYKNKDGLDVLSFGKSEGLKVRDSIEEKEVKQ